MTMAKDMYHVNEGFRYENGHLFCEDVKVTSLIGTTVSDTTVKTPVFVYSRRQILHNISRYQRILDDLNRKYILNYSVKANANLSLLRIFKEHGLSLTLVSGTELKFALTCEFVPDRIVFNGNGKLDEEVELAIVNDVILNIDSTFNMKQTIRICKETKRRARILLRINTGINPNVHQYVSTGQVESKFGLSTKELAEVLEIAKTSTEVIVVGLHSHLGSTITNTDLISVKCLKKLWRDMKEKGFKYLEFINIGGGLDIDYKQQATYTMPCRALDDHLKTLVVDMESQMPSTDPAKKLLQDVLSERKSIEDLKDWLKTTTSSEFEELRTEMTRMRPTTPTPEELIKSIANLLDDDMTLILEPGRSLIANAAVLCSTVLGCKESGDKRYMVIDGSMTEVVRPCLYGAYHHIDLTSPAIKVDADDRDPGADDRMVYDVVGPVCESADFLGKDRLLNPPQEGQGVAVFDVGAYCGSMASNYNLRIRPAEVLIDGSSVHLIRKPDSVDELIRPFLIR